MQKYIELKLNGKFVRVYVENDVKAHFDEQFVREKPSVLQKKKYTTLMNLMNAAYKQGFMAAEKKDKH